KCPKKVAPQNSFYTRLSDDIFSITVGFCRDAPSSPRYICLAKTHLQNIAIGGAMNIDRLFNWFQGVLFAKTQVSHFQSLEAA
uniref:hypothetical protein n=1 Tax=Synechococcus sp. BDU 130192 TaxID=2042059 RepID=UPI001C1F573D